MPLFLELVRIVSETRPQLASKALDGLALYEQAERARQRPERPAIARVGGTSLRDCGGSGAPVVLIPSLINPPHVLDLDDNTSLAAAIAQGGRRSLLLDWGTADDRAELDLAGHIERLLLPLIGQLGERPALVGYCLGGTMAIAAANLAPVERVATLAAPWRFARYPDAGRKSLLTLWNSARPVAIRLEALPMEVLQSAFWSMDPERTVAKFAAFAELDPHGDKARRFVTLEDWANEGEALPYPAARALIEQLFEQDLPGRGEWRVGGRAISDRLSCLSFHITASGDRITPAATAPAGETVQLDAGHVGMIVGSARHRLHQLLQQFLAA
ncbi:alpha/beta fold hydrolase [Sphingomonas sabuli]|uniref:alpha/beta fold hydrolase n=1 Tax=Sphingomonas sabuli TaxID=2764186 RepID=UPI001FE7E079|nr:alpha/beta fold hydrolase [Sphingomonas sabuli]